MAIPAGVQKIVFSGPLGDGERFQTGFWLQGGLPSDAGAANAQAELMWDTAESGDASGAMRITRGAFWDALTSIDEVLCYVYATGGSTADFVGTFSPPTPLVGDNTAKLPLQTCAVLTLRTDLAGRRHRGRMYLPATAAVLDNDHEFTSTDISAVAAGWATFFTDVAASDAGTPVVVSRIGTSAQAISSVTMDSRPDIQRRRANSQGPITRANGDVG